MKEEVDNTLENGVDVVFEVALVGLDLRKEEWLVNSGASRHVSRDRSVFSTLDLTLGTLSVQTAGNENLTVHRTCSIYLGPSGEVNISNVYYVPRLTRNLLSVGKIADAGYVLVFDKE